MTVLIYGAPGDSPDLFHAIPTPIIDPFLYLEDGDRRGATVTVLDADKVTPHGVEVIDPYDLGGDELLDSGMSRDDVELELCLRAAQRYGVTRALVPSEFPIVVADHLRAGGIELMVDPEAFVPRRRVKTGAELDGIRRAQKAADAAMGVAARLIRELRRRDLRAGARRDAGGVRRARLRPARRRDRLARPAVARSGTSPATARSAPASR